jgi:hypothetical protein
MMVSYKDLCKIRLTSNPCPICGKRPEQKDAKWVELEVEEPDGSKRKFKAQVCKAHEA